MIERYVNEMVRVEKLIEKKLAWRGLVSSVARCTPSFVYTITMYYSTYLIASKQLNVIDVIKLVSCMIEQHRC